MRNLAATYRPTKLADVVGQEQAKTILANHLANNPKSSYLFTGSAGTGKTTCARIFARELNGGSDFNTIEINAADNTGVDGVRKIIADAGKLPIGTPYKVFILDECHMLSTQAWNALLKLIEEPPTTVVFLFCTTDSQKIPATIISRVLRVDFCRLQSDLIVSRLEWILEQEQLAPISKESLRYIAELSNGGMRDAISLLDKVLGYGIEVTPELINTALGLLGDNKACQLMEYLCQHDTKATIEFVDSLNSGNFDYKSWILDFRRFIIKATMVKLDVPAHLYVLSDDIIARIKQIATVPELFRISDELNTLCTELVMEQDPYTHIMASLCILAGGTE